MRFNSKLSHHLSNLAGPTTSLRGRLVRGGVGSLAVKLLSTFLGLALTIVLARALGPEGYGTYSYIFALVSLIAIPAQFGLPTLVMRETAKAQVNQQWGLMRGLWRWTSIMACVLSAIIALGGAAIAWLLADHFTKLQLTTFFWGLILIPLITLGNLRGAALQGLRRVVLGQLPENVLRPSLLILLVLGTVLFLPAETFSAAHALVLYTAAAAVAFVIGAWLLWRERPMPLREGPAPVYEMRTWLGAVLPLALIAGIQSIHIDVLMLGIFVTTEDVGIYRVATQGSALVGLGANAVNMVVTPYFAHLYAQGNMMLLQRIVTLSAKVMLIIVFPLVLVIVLFGEDILCIVFGFEYVLGYTPLSILAIGQLVSVGMGSVATLLNMTGHERDTAHGVILAMMINLVLNLILIPYYGIIGAAIATLFTLVASNVFLWIIVRRRLGIETMAFSIKKLQIRQKA